jgi:hypothetical protein
MRLRHAARERGFAMAALLVGMGVMAIAMSMLLPAWRTMAQREKEAELVFRGDQYARAIRLYQERRGAYPPDIDTLVRERFLRKKYKDPITNDDFEVVRLGQALPGQVTLTPQQQQQQRQQQQQQARMIVGGSLGGGPIIGVVSKSTGTSLKVINGKTKYNEMPFTPTATAQQPGQGNGALTPGGTGTSRPGGAGARRPGGAGSTQGNGSGGLRMQPIGPSGGGSGLQLPGGGRR